MATRIVTLFGKLLRSRQSGVTILDVDGALGHAREFGLAGQIRLLDRQVLEAHYDPGAADGSNQGKDIVRIPEHVARSLMPPPSKRQRRG